MKRGCLSVPLVVVLISTAQADIIGVTGGYVVPPPEMLGPYEMTPFPLDDRPLLEDVTSVPSPLGGEVVFSVPMMHSRFGVWGYWPYLLPPDFYTQPLPGEVTLDLPLGTRAFYLYAVTDFVLTITATTDDGTTAAQTVFGPIEAAYFGFYAEDVADTISSITVISDYYPSSNLSVGAFGVAVPEPNSLLLLGAALLAVPRRRPAR